MKTLLKYLILLMVLITSCSSPNMVEENNHNFVDNTNPSDGNYKIIYFSTTVINNQIVQMDLFTPYSNNHTLLLNNNPFCYGSDIQSFDNCNQNNINNLQNSFGNTLEFLLDGHSMPIYNPELMHINCPNKIDKNLGFTLTWEDDPNNPYNQVIIGITPRIDGNGDSYNNKESFLIQHIANDTGSYTINSQDLADFSSGDIVDIYVMRGNLKNFSNIGKDNVRIKIFTTNVVIAKIL